MDSITITYASGAPEIIPGAASVDVVVEVPAGEASLAFCRGHRRITSIDFTLTANPSTATVGITPGSGQLPALTAAVAEDISQPSPETVTWTATPTLATMVTRIPSSAPAAVMYLIATAVDGGRSMNVNVHR